MSLFWNDNRPKDQGRFLPLSKLSPDQAIIHFDDQWQVVTTLSDNDLLKMSEADVAAFSDLTPGELNIVIRQALNSWRINPGSSFLNVIHKTNKPQAGTIMFDDLSLQTRVLAALLATPIQLPWRRSLEAVHSDKGQRRAHQVHGMTAITASDKGIANINKIARGLRVWEMRNAAFIRDGRIKLPKKFYRGLREKHVRLEMERQEKPDGISHHQFSGEHTQRHYEAMLGKNVSSILHSPILSFSSNESVAKFFTVKRATYSRSIHPP